MVREIECFAEDAFVTFIREIYLFFCFRKIRLYFLLLKFFVYIQLKW